MPEQKKIQKIIAPREKHWVGDGFHVSTIFSMHSEDVDSISPFLLMDHAAPRYFPPTQQKLGVGEHPHRGPGEDVHLLLVSVGLAGNILVQHGPSRGKD